MTSNVLEVPPEAQILSVRVIDDDSNDGDVTGPGPDPLVQGIDYALTHGADVISLSLGGGAIASSFNQRQVAAMGRAASARVPVLAGAGNEGDDLNGISYPAGYPTVISVAAVGKNGRRADFSQVHTYNSIAAPRGGHQVREKPRRLRIHRHAGVPRRSRPRQAAETLHSQLAVMRPLAPRWVGQRRVASSMVVSGGRPFCPG